MYLSKFKTLWSQIVSRVVLVVFFFFFAILNFECFQSLLLSQFRQTIIHYCFIGQLKPAYLSGVFSLRWRPNGGFGLLSTSWSSGCLFDTIPVYIQYFTYTIKFLRFSDWNELSFFAWYCYNVECIVPIYISGISNMYINRHLNLLQQIVIGI